MNLKNNCLLKKLLKWANKKCKNLNVYNPVFFLKKEKTPVDVKTSQLYDLQFLRYRV